MSRSQLGSWYSALECRALGFSGGFRVQGSGASGFRLRGLGLSGFRLRARLAQAYEPWDLVVILPHHPGPCRQRELLGVEGFRERMHHVASCSVFRRI